MENKLKDKKAKKRVLQVLGKKKNLNEKPLEMQKELGKKSQGYVLGTLVKSQQQSEKQADAILKLVEPFNQNSTQREIKKSEVEEGQILETAQATKSLGQFEPDYFAFEQIINPFFGEAEKHEQQNENNKTKNKILQEKTKISISKSSKDKNNLIFNKGKETDSLKKSIFDRIKNDEYAAPKLQDYRDINSYDNCSN